MSTLFLGEAAWERWVLWTQEACEARPPGPKGTSFWGGWPGSKVPVLTVCKQYAGLARILGQEVCKVQFLAVEFHVFMMFPTPRANIPTKEQGVACNLFSHGFHSSFDLEMFSYAQLCNKKRKYSSRTFWPHLYLNPLSV